MIEGPNRQFRGNTNTRWPRGGRARPVQSDKTWALTSSIEIPRSANFRISKKTGFSTTTIAKKKKLKKNPEQMNWCPHANKLQSSAIILTFTCCMLCKLRNNLSLCLLPMRIFPSNLLICDIQRKAPINLRTLGFGRVTVSLAKFSTLEHYPENNDKKCFQSRLIKGTFTLSVCVTACDVAISEMRSMFPLPPSSKTDLKTVRSGKCRGSVGISLWHVHNERSSYM